MSRKAFKQTIWNVHLKCDECGRTETVYRYARTKEGAMDDWPSGFWNTWCVKDGKDICAQCYTRRKQNE